VVPVNGFVPWMMHGGCWVLEHGVFGTETKSAGVVVGDTWNVTVDVNVPVTE
jgi:hypothetical protein